jgi:two-component system chemotaxis sensor kinase CheA
MDSELQAIYDEFFNEANELLNHMDEAIVALETAPHDAELLRTVFRGAHTIKGNASSLGFDAAGTFAHTVEDVLAAVRDHALAITPALTSLLLESVDALRAVLASAAKGDHALSPAHKAFLAKLAAWVSNEQADVQAQAAEATEAAAKAGDEQAGANGDAAQSSVAASHTIRIGIDKLDRMLNLTGEITIFRGRFAQRLEVLREQTGIDILEMYREADRLYIDMQEQVMKLRMVPVGPVFRHFVRTVRDVATSHGKIVRLTLEGSDVEVDTRVIELLRDPLMHMIRNAVDHGVEAPEARRAAGKDPSGHLVLRAAHEAGMVVIELSDDGAGLNRDRIYQKGLAAGYFTEGEHLSEDEVLDFIFQPGFSTAAEVSDLSGRGVGLDVVKRNVEALRGNVAVTSRPMQGTTFTIRLPLTMAIIDGFRVGVGDDTFVIPLDSVIECMELPKEDVPHEDGNGVFFLRGAPLPYLRLGRLFGAQAGASARENVVVVEAAHMRAGLVVDTLLGEGQVVVKPLGKMFQDIPGISGSTVLGNGRVSLILDVPALISRVAHAGRQTAAEAPAHP